MNAVTPLTDHYVGEFEELSAALPGGGLDWLRELRRRGIDTFAEIGFPTTRNEHWKYTNLRQLTRHRYISAAPAGVAALSAAIEQAGLPELDCYRMTFVNGRFVAPLSRVDDLPHGLELLTLSSALGKIPGVLEQHLAQYASGRASGFAALNEAFMQDGAVVRIAPGTALDKPVHLVFAGAPEAEPAWQHLRNLVYAGANSSATLVETFVGVGDAVMLSNTVTEAVLEPGANITHYKLQAESLQNYHISTLQAHQAEDSRFDSYSVSSGARLARHDINVDLAGNGAECSLYGLYMAGGKQHVDYHTRVDHREPHCSSREFYKGVLGGRARAVFNGQVYVHPDAQKTNAEQSNRNLLLSPDAEVDTKPQLEIYADDVKCSHGATVGQLDDNMLFYLRARGIGEELARAMLTYGFAHDLVDRMPLAPVRANVEKLLMRQLPNADDLGEPMLVAE